MFVFFLFRYREGGVLFPSGGAREEPEAQQAHVAGPGGEPFQGGGFVDILYIQYNFINISNLHTFTILNSRENL